VYLEITLIAYLIDRIFGEFGFIKYYKHPVVFMGDFIKWFEEQFYKDSILRGVILTLSLLAVVFSIVFTIEYFVDNIFILGLLASMGLASKMLYESVKNVCEDPQSIRYLVSRDTKDLSQSDINKAAIETYAENLSDGVIAPLFYLLLFGVTGLFLYKAVNTLDSMVGYRNERYEKFGKASARLDDILNYIPSRLTALLIALLFLSKKAFFEFADYGKKHESINAGYPISAMALSIGVKLGGATSYFGKVKQKPFFGEGKEQISSEDITKALSFRAKLDIFTILFLSISIWSIN
jgi:adenosylcobinamide-phosphate synthase